MNNFDSIFANPEQEKLFVRPYDKPNTKICSFLDDCKINCKAKMISKVDDSTINYDLLTELDLSGSSIPKQFKKANKLNAKSVVIIGEEEANNNKFIIRKFCENEEKNIQEIIAFKDNRRLENWLQINLNLRLTVTR